MDPCIANNKIIFIPCENSCKGRGFQNPIEIDDEVEVLGARQSSRGSSRKNPIIVEQAWLPRFHRLRSGRTHSFTKPSMEDLWVGKPVIEIGESSGISMEERLEMEFRVSSSSVSCHPNFECEICAESKHPRELFSMDGCSHTYCKSCISQYVTTKVEENVLFITCPDPDCSKGKLEPILCSRILEDRVFDIWCKALCELTICDKFYCPFKDCSALLINDAECVIADAVCPHCNRLFCAQCRVPWHESFSCSDFQNLGEDERKKEDLMLMKLAKERKWKRCPSCKFFVERTDGCAFMTCRCGFKFCYVCATGTTMDHYCKTCKR